MLISFLLYHFLTSFDESKWVKGSSLADIKQIEQITLLNWGRTSHTTDSGPASAELFLFINIHLQMSLHF